MLSVYVVEDINPLLSGFLRQACRDSNPHLLFDLKQDRE
jgi:hypothetical protein